MLIFCGECGVILLMLILVVVWLWVVGYVVVWICVFVFGVIVLLLCYFWDCECLWLVWLGVDELYFVVGFFCLDGVVMVWFYWLCWIDCVLGVFFVEWCWVVIGGDFGFSVVLVVVGLLMGDDLMDVLVIIDGDDVLCWLFVILCDIFIGLCCLCLWFVMCGV